MANILQTFPFSKCISWIEIMYFYIKTCMKLVPKGWILCIGKKSALVKVVLSSN